MFIPKENRVATFAYLFKEGVLVVKKDTRSPTHPASKSLMVAAVVRIGDWTSVSDPGLTHALFLYSYFFRS